MQAQNVRLYYEPWKKSSLSLNLRERAGQSYVTWKTLEYVIASHIAYGCLHPQMYRVIVHHLQGRIGNDRPPVLSPVVHRLIQDCCARKPNALPSLRLYIQVRDLTSAVTRMHANWRRAEHTLADKMRRLGFNRNVCRGIFRFIQNYLAGYKEMATPEDFFRQYEKAREKLSHRFDDYSVAPKITNTLDVCCLWQSLECFAYSSSSLLCPK